MSQSLGASRMSAAFSVPVDADDNLQAMLALYKSPATISDMKQVFFYVNASSTVTTVNPNELFYNVSFPTPGDVVVSQVYYALIGTTREFNIVDKVNDLMDIRVPKDKYVIEINLVECVIEADTTSWSRLPDRVVTRDPDVEVPVFNWANSYANPDGSVPPKQTLNTILQQATKQSQPQTLFCRIKELCNGEPFNWSVTNSGAYSIDKSHQLLVRHGDINYAKLTLEFGHLAFTGLDQDYKRFLTDPSQQSPDFITEVNNYSGLPPLTTLSDTARDFKYIDYNREVYNAVVDPNLPTEYPEFYKGDGGILYGALGSTSQPGAVNLIQPANRPPFVEQSTGGATPYQYLLQGKPLFYNQQASRIGFRFMVRIIHMF